MTHTKKSKKQKLSADERARRAEQRRRAIAEFHGHPLLYPRSHARYLLQCSDATLIRLEQRGLLRPIKFDPDSPAAATHYTHDNLMALVKGEGGDHA